MNPEQLNAALIAASRLERHREFILEGALRVALSGAIDLRNADPVDVTALIVADYYSLLTAARNSVAHGESLDSCIDERLAEGLGAHVYGAIGDGEKNEVTS